MGTELLAFESAEGESVVFAVSDTDPGVELVGRGSRGELLPGPVQLEAALDTIRTASEAVLDRLKQVGQRPYEVEVEFGVQMNAKVGAIIAATEAQGHLRVKVKWQPGR
jgi:NTP-dependent ternary system trypsin peptidase co-occuring protein